MKNIDPIYKITCIHAYFRQCTCTWHVMFWHRKFYIRTYICHITFSSVFELSHSRLAKPMWKIGQAAFVSSFRFTVEKKKKEKRILEISKLFALHVNAKRLMEPDAINLTFAVIKNGTFYYGLKPSSEVFYKKICP